MTIRNWDGAIRATPRTSESCDGPRGSISMRALGLAGHCSLQARLALVSLASIAEWRVNTTSVSPHRTMTCTDDGGRVTDGAGSSVAAEWSNRASTVTFQPLPGWCGCVYKPWWLWPLRMVERLSKRATRGGERHSTEAPGHRIRAPRPERPARSVWTRRACFPGVCGPGGSSDR